MPKRRYEDDGRPITPEPIDYNDSSIIAIATKLAAEASSCVPMALGNVGMSTWPTLENINMAGSSAVQTSAPGYDFSIAGTSGVQTSAPGYDFSIAGASAVQTSAPGYDFSNADVSQPQRSFQFDPSTWPPPTQQAAASGNFVASSYNENRFEVFRMEAEKAVETEQQMMERNQQDGSELGAQQGHPPEQVDGCSSQGEDEDEEEEEDFSYLKHVLMAMDYREAEKDDPYYG